MAVATSAVAIAALAAWISLAWFRGGFWKCDQRLAATPATATVWPDVVAVIPARDEAATIGEAVQSLLLQDYAGGLHIIVVDDDSSDGTGAIAAEADRDGGRVTVVRGRPLPEGWVGKVWALAQGLQHAVRWQPRSEYVLLTDADIAHDPRAVARLVTKAEADELDLVSLMVRLHCRDPWERLLIPAFVFFFQMLFPFSWVNDRRRPTAAAAGGCMLVRQSALAAAGGIAAIRDRLIDDCALADRLKPQGGIWLGLTTTIRSLRPYDGLADIWRMVARTAFTQLGYSGGALLGTVVAMLLVFVVPPAVVVAGVVSGDTGTVAIGATAWLTMAMLARPTARLYGQPSWWGVLLPAAALLYTLMTIDSARRFWQGRGSAWKGRRYVDPRTDCA